MEKIESEIDTVTTSIKLNAWWIISTEDEEEKKYYKEQIQIEVTLLKELINQL